MDIDEPLFSRTPGFSEPSTSTSTSTSTSSRAHIRRDFPSGFLDLPVPSPRGRRSTAHLYTSNDIIIPVIAAAAAARPSSGSYINLISNLNVWRKVTHRSHSAPSVFTDAMGSTSPTMDQLVDALYFTVVTLCTIGYGDIVPSTTFTKLFTCAFILVGFGFVGILLNGLVSYICDRQEAVMLGTVDENGFNTMVRTYMIDTKKGRMRIRIKVAFALATPASFIAIGMIAIRYLERLSWVDSFYMSITSVTTVGYGDYSFSTIQGRIFAVIWLLVSTLTVARAFLFLTELRIDKRNRRMAKWVLQKKVTLGDLVAADLDNDGCIR